MDDSQRKLGSRVRRHVRADLLRRRGRDPGRRPGRPGARQRPRDRAHGDRRRAHLGRALQPGGDALDARDGRIEPAEAVRYWVSQLAGATAAALVLLAIFPSAMHDAVNLGVPAVAQDPASVLATRSWPRSWARSSSSSSSTASPSTSAAPSRSSPGLPIGLTISIGVLAVGGVSGAAFNPARWFGPALVSGTFDNFWVWILGPGDRRRARRPGLRPPPAQGHRGRVGPDSPPLVPCGGTALAVPPHGATDRQGRWHERRERRARAARDRACEGVSLGETEIALVDGENGRLIYRGHDAERLAHESTFEATAFLLWNGRLPDDAELAELRHRAVAAMVVPAEVHDAIRSLGDGRAADGRAAHGPLGLGRAARTRRGRRQRGRPVGARGDARDRRRLRPPAHGRRDPRARSRARDRRELPAQAQRAAPRARRRPARSTRTSSSAPSTA